MQEVEKVVLARPCCAVVPSPEQNTQTVPHFPDRLSSVVALLLTFLPIPRSLERNCVFARLATWQPKQLQVISKVVIGQKVAHFSPSSESLESFLFLVKVFLMAPQHTFRVCVNAVSTWTKHTFCVHFIVVLGFPACSSSFCLRACYQSA